MWKAISACNHWWKYISVCENQAGSLLGDGGNSCDAKGPCGSAVIVDRPTTQRRENTTGADASAALSVLAEKQGGGDLLGELGQEALERRRVGEALTRCGAARRERATEFVNSPGGYGDRRLGVRIRALELRTPKLRTAGSSCRFRSRARSRRRRWPWSHRSHKPRGEHAKGRRRGPLDGDDRQFQ